MIQQTTTSLQSSHGSPAHVEAMPSARNLKGVRQLFDPVGWIPMGEG